MSPPGGTAAGAAPGSPQGAYPASSAVDVALRDGSTLHVRPVRAEDRPRIERFLHGLSPRSIGFRFFGQIDLAWVARWSLDVDYADRYALVAVAGPEQEVVAHAAYVRTGGDSAEVAFTVADAWQGHGIATIMLAHLAAAAQDHGIELFTAEVLPANHRMIAVFRDSGFPFAQQVHDGVIRIELPTSRSEDTREHFERREQVAAVAAMSRFLRPRSVALIGASERPRTIGAELVRNLESFAGEVHLVNPRTASLGGRPAHRSLAAIGEQVELAVVAVPAGAVCSVARECAAAGVRALLVISAGFAETGEEGAARQQELLSICRDSGMRLIGPNCLGVLNTAAAVRLNATFAPMPPPGPIGFLSQSGGLGIAIVEAASRMELGLSSFVSVGNKADISGNDLLEYWEGDPHTAVILLYLESFGNPRRFARISRRVGASKPIVALKSGRSPAGARATSSHTGALIATSDVTVDALFRQAGVIRTDTMQELFDVGALLASERVPGGPRVAVVTNAGGPGILCADACQAASLDVAPFGVALRSTLGSFLPAEASLANPVDMIASAPADSYLRTIEAIAQADAADAVIAVFVPPLVTAAEDVARELREAKERCGDRLTLLSVFMNSGGQPRGEEGEARLAGFAFPEDAARALGHAARYGSWRRRPAGVIPRPEGSRPEEAAAIIAGAISEGPGWLDPGRVAALLGCYGLPMIGTRLVHGVREAALAAGELDGPVALKAVARGLQHKSDAGGVRLGLSGAAEVAEAGRAIAASVGAAGYELEGLLVQPMVPPGVELLLGVVHDESFGPVIACGAGGTNTEVLGDVAVRITPLTDLDAREMLRSLRTFALLEGYRGSPPCDVAAVEDALLRLSAMVEAHPEIAELDANPLVASPAGATIVDARVRLSPVGAPTPLPSLRPRRP